MERAVKVVQGADKVVNVFLAVIITVAMLFGCFSLWDTYRIYDNAGVSAGLLRYKPQGTSTQSLSDLIALNPDVRGWLTVDDTNIDYPFVQGNTNMDYVNTDIYGDYSLSGSIFMDCRNEPDLSDFYVLLYGHHMDGGKMFGDLENFHENTFFESHTTGTLYTEDKIFQLDFFACVAIDAYDKQVFEPTSHEDSTQKSALLAYIKENAIQYREIGLNTQNQILGLSTCSDATTNGRTVVYARMTEIAD